jgi:hypothetical protein
MITETALLALIAAGPENGPRKPLVDMLFPAQRRVWDTTARFYAVLFGRRTGKTFLAAAKLIVGSKKRAGLYVYLALTQRSARLIVWPIIRALAEREGLGQYLHEQTLTLGPLPNGSQVICTGTDDMRTIETWRGTKLAGVVVDECGSQPDSLLRYLIDDILRPALLDVQGWLMLCGTPGLVMAGYWFELTGPERISKVPVFPGTVYDNPTIPHAARELEAMCEEKGWTRDTPTFRREWLAEWCEDTGSLVFPLGPQNHADALPTKSRTGAPLDPNLWRYVIGVDVGVVDATAIAVVAAHPNDPREWIIRTEKWNRWIVDQLAARLRELKAIYPGAPIVLDTGGMGKLHAEELQRRFALPIRAAEKREKESAVRVTRDLLLAGRILVLTGPANDPLRDEWAALDWDKTGRLPNPNAAHGDHASDATGYALRALRHYRRGEEPTPLNARELRAESVKEMKQRRMNQMRNSGREVWDR